MFVAIAFLVFRWFDADSKRKKLQAHYHKLSRDALCQWRDLANSEGKLSNGNVPAYAESAGKIFRSEPWYRWALDHIRSGYPDLWDIVSTLRSLEHEHGKLVSSIADATAQEVADMLRSFQKLSASYEKTPTDYYLPDRLIKAAREPWSKLEVVHESVVRPSGIREWIKPRVAVDLCMNGETIARSDGETVSRLEQAVEEIRQKHLQDLDRLRASMKAHTELLNKFAQEVGAIISEVENSESMRGECDYERSLGH